MSHFIASIVKPSKETKTQDVESPLPFSPEADIELTAPSSNATPPSPKEQLSKQLSITAKSLENKDEKQDSLTDPLRLDLSIGPSTSTNLPTADQPAPSSSPIDRRASIGAASSSGAWGPVTPRDEASDPLLLRSRLVGEQDIRRRPSVKGKGNEKNIKEFYENQNNHIEYLLKPMYKHASDDEQEVESNALKVSQIRTENEAVSNDSKQVANQRQKEVTLKRKRRIDSRAMTILASRKMIYKLSSRR